MKILAFDSGIGGLTALAPLIHTNKGLEIEYLGDLANLPYGTKSPQRVEQLVEAHLFWMLKHFTNNASPNDVSQQIGGIVVACNTASAHCKTLFEKIASTYKIPIFEVIAPGCHSAIQGSPNRIVVLATSATVASGAYVNQLRQMGFQNEIVQKACPLFVPMVEEQIVSGIALEWVVQHYLKSVIQDQDTVILGCTHYPYLLKTLEQTFKSTLKSTLKSNCQNIKWVDAGASLIQDSVMANLLLTNQSTAPNQLNMHFTDPSLSPDKIEFFTSSLGIKKENFTIETISPIV